VRPRTLDHVALWVADRDSIARIATERLGMHVIERTDRFTLIGSDARCSRPKARASRAR
jgi:catechol 2,3-dioxygenase-like lactoylglutathione lyase family enzyme